MKRRDMAKAAATAVAVVGTGRAAGGSVDVVDLPERGIKGNSHMMMMDHNNEQVTAVVQDWLASKGLWS